MQFSPYSTATRFATGSMPTRSLWTTNRSTTVINFGRSGDAARIQAILDEAG